MYRIINSHDPDSFVEVSEGTVQITIADDHYSGNLSSHDSCVLAHEILGQADDSLKQLDGLLYDIRASELSKNGGRERDPMTVLCDTWRMFLSTANNRDALWVWSRFLWAFGRRDTWRASNVLDDILMIVLRIDSDLQRLSGLYFWQLETKRRLKHQIELNQSCLHRLLGDVFINHEAWNDLAAFRGYERK